MRLSQLIDDAVAATTASATPAGATRERSRPARSRAPARRRRAAARQAGRHHRRTPRCSARSGCSAREKAGHTGTLDPLATGLLPLCFGEATKFAQRPARRAQGATSRRSASASTTTTGDAEGEVVATRAGRRSIARDSKRRCRVSSARSTQVPPMYCGAQASTGRRSTSTRAPASRSPRAPRAVDDRRARRSIDWSPPRRDARVACSKGTYVRVLAEDIGAALGCGAHLAALRRTARGGFALDGARDARRARGDGRRERATRCCCRSTRWSPALPRGRRSTRGEAAALRARAGAIGRRRASRRTARARVTARRDASSGVGRRRRRRRAARRPRLAVAARVGKAPAELA